MTGVSKNDHYQATQFLNELLLALIKTSIKPFLEFKRFLNIEALKFQKRNLIMFTLFQEYNKSIHNILFLHDVSQLNFDNDFSHIQRQQKNEQRVAATKNSQK